MTSQQLPTGQRLSTLRPRPRKASFMSLRDEVVFVRTLRLPGPEWLVEQIDDPITSRRWVPESDLSPLTREQELALGMRH